MRYTKFACWVFFGLVLAANGVHAQEDVQEASQLSEQEAPNPVEIEAYDKLLRDADSLIKGGKPADAYTLLEPLEFGHSGEVRFDYLIGIAALDSGKPDKATLAFERVLAEDPDFVGAHLDMARALYQLGDMPRAKAEFEIVLKQNPSEAARGTIQKYLAGITGQENRKRTRINGFIEGTFGRDTNVNNAAEQTQTTAGNIATTLNSTAVEMVDYYFGVAAGGEIVHSMNDNWRLYAVADLRQRNNLTQTSYDTFSLDGGAGVLYGTEADRIRVGLLGEQHSLGGSRDRDTSGINAEWSHVVDRANQLNVFGQHIRYRYVGAALGVNDFNQQAMGFGRLHVLEDGTTAFSGSLYFGTENEVAPVTLANPGGGRTDGNKRFGGFRVRGQASTIESIKLYAGLGIQIGRYSKVNPVLLSTRFDYQYDLSLGANWNLDKQWTALTQLTRFRNFSNISRYAFDRSDISITIRRSFN